MGYHYANGLVVERCNLLSNPTDLAGRAPALKSPAVIGQRPPLRYRSHLPVRRLGKARRRDSGCS